MGNLYKARRETATFSCTSELDISFQDREPYYPTIPSIVWIRSAIIVLFIVYTNIVKIYL